jgi:5-methylcytosine-specific restriction protein B
MNYRHRQKELCTILKNAGFEGNLVDEGANGKRKPLEVMDPFTFIGFFQKIKNEEKRKAYLKELKKLAGFHSPIPSDFNGLPSAQALALCYFIFERERPVAQLDTLWDFAEQAVKGELKAETFQTVLSYKGIRLAKLTQGLFWLNPDTFYPVDAHRHFLVENGINVEVETLDEYLVLLKKIKEKFNQPFYEISHRAWLSSSEIGDSEEEFSDFDLLKMEFKEKELYLFFSLLQMLVNHFKLANDDQRVVFSLRDNRFNFTVGQRYCMNLGKEAGETFYGFISTVPISKSYFPFSGEPQAYWNTTNDINELQKNQDNIITAVQRELERTTKSSFYRFDNKDFRNKVFHQGTGNFLSKESSMSHPLNQILYGPPGTGKTYKTIEKAIEIANPDFLRVGRNRDELKAEYERLKDAGQIEFITFHQSMSYEDFIEGIKPVKPGEEDEFLKYEVKPGLFKSLVNRALYEPAPAQQAFSITEDEFEKATFFKMSLGNTLNPDDAKIYRYCIDNGCIGLGWGDAYDFTGKPEDEIQKMAPGALTKTEARFVNTFVHYMKKGDYVIVSNGNLLFRAIGKVVGDYEYRNAEGIEIKQFRKVEWLLKDVEISYENIYYKQFMQQTLYYLNKNEIKKDFLVKTASETTGTVNKKNYVMIIDEINRGNIAQIFGELITLIETDKRKGNPEVLEVRLPYSGDLFTVPGNLYIIGTMNTADRSVEALDTALRRRFVFEELMPDPEIIKSVFEQEYLSLCARNDTLQWDDDGWLTFESSYKDVIEGYPDAEEFSKFQENVNDKDLPRKFAEYYECWKSAGVKLVTVEKLKLINSRIEVLLNRDHLIGHSYFIGKYTRKSVYNTFYQNIIPLLKEYFFGDFGKIGLILGKDFVTVTNQENTTLLADFDYPGVEDFDEKIIYRINEFKDQNGRPDYDAFYQAFCAI